MFDTGPMGLSVEGLSPFYYEGYISVLEDHKKGIINCAKKS